MSSPTEEDARLHAFERAVARITDACTRLRRSMTTIPPTTPDLVLVEDIRDLRQATRTARETLQFIVPPQPDPEK